jgi:hypothetical protein
MVCKTVKAFAGIRHALCKHTASVSRTRGLAAIGCVAGAPSSVFESADPQGENLSRYKLKLHLFDLLWICCTTSCTANPQQIHNISTCQDVVNLLWTSSTTNPQQIDQTEYMAFDLSAEVEKLNNKSTANQQQIHKNRTSGF